MAQAALIRSPRWFEVDDSISSGQLAYCCEFNAGHRLFAGLCEKSQTPFGGG